MLSQCMSYFSPLLLPLWLFKKYSSISFLLLSLLFWLWFSYSLVLMYQSVQNVDIPPTLGNPWTISIPWDGVQIPHLRVILSNQMSQHLGQTREKSVKKREKKVTLKWTLTAGLSLSFKSPVAWISTPIANILIFGWILSITGNFTHSIKGKADILSRNRC